MMKVTMKIAVLLCLLLQQQQSAVICFISSGGTTASAVIKAPFRRAAFAVGRPRRLSSTMNLQLKQKPQLLYMTSAAEPITKPASMPSENKLNSHATYKNFSRKRNPTTNASSTTTTNLGTLEVAKIGVGTISWTSTKLTKLENPELQQIVTTAMNDDNSSNNGGVLFDTAERYGNHWKTALGMGWGETERLITKLVQEEEERKQHTKNVVIATKFTPSPWRTTSNSVVQACLDSCQRLQTSSIDLYQIHMPNLWQGNKRHGSSSKDIDEVYWNGMIECYERGYIQNVGVCNYGPTKLQQCYEYLDKHNVPLASNQIAYSVLNRGSQRTVDMCNALNVKVLGYVPYAMGLLTGKYFNRNDETSSSPSSLLHAKKSTFETYELQKFAKQLQPLYVVMDEIARRYNVSMGQVALQYCMYHDVIPIPGARTVEQYSQNNYVQHVVLKENDIRLLQLALDNADVPEFTGAGMKRTNAKFVGYGMEQWRMD